MNDDLNLKSNNENSEIPPIMKMMKYPFRIYKYNEIETSLKIKKISNQFTIKGLNFIQISQLLHYPLDQIPS